MNLSMEHSLTLSLNGTPYITIACSGSDMREMAAGHLLTEGIISNPGDILSMTFDGDSMTLNVEIGRNDGMLECIRNNRRFPRESSSGGEVVRQPSGRTSIAARTVLPMMNEFLQHSPLHHLTHGVHSAALFTAEGKRLSFFDEIGRHNAIDKVLGHALLNGIDLSDKVAATTGRVASEIIIKFIRASVPIVVSRAVPTSLSLELAIRHGIVLVGRARESSFTVFNGKWALTP